MCSCKEIVPMEFSDEAFKELRTGIMQIEMYFQKWFLFKSKLQDEKYPLIKPLYYGASKRRGLSGQTCFRVLLSRGICLSVSLVINKILRPPGVVNDNDFQKKCVRCGECIKAASEGAFIPTIPGQACTEWSCPSSFLVADIANTIATSADRSAPRARYRTSLWRKRRRVSSASPLSTKTIVSLTRRK